MSKIKDFIDKNTLGISFSVTALELSESKNEKLLSHMTSEYGRRLGERIAKTKAWTMTPIAEDSMLIKQLEVVVFTPEEVMELVRLAGGYDA